jgi:hypothetical protein
MSIALVEAWREKQRVKWIVKFLLRRVAQPCVLVVLAYIFPKLAIFYAICGLYDVSRNRVNVTTLRRYFLGNGFATGRCRQSMFSWTLSRCLTSTGASIGLGTCRPLNGKR